MASAAGLLSVQGAANRPPMVVACALNQQERARVIDAFRGRAALRFIESFDALLDGLRDEVSIVDVVILPAVDGRDGGANAERVVRRLVVERPRIAIIAYCAPHGGYSSEIRALAAAGVHQFVFAGVDDHGAMFRNILALARQGCAAEWVMQQVGPIVPVQLHRMVEAILTNPSRATTLLELARALGVHRKTLFNWCDRVPFLPPAELLAWTRLALVAYHLENTACTVETIALELGYPSDTTLRNTIKRYTGLRANDVRRRGGLRCVLEAMQRRLDGDNCAVAH